jgi:hypothetical protein
MAIESWRRKWGDEAIWLKLLLEWLPRKCLEDHLLMPSSSTTSMTFLSASRMTSVIKDHERACSTYDQFLIGWAWGLRAMNGAHGECEWSTGDLTLPRHLITSLVLPGVRVSLIFYCGPDFGHWFRMQIFSIYGTGHTDFNCGLIRLLNLDTDIGY